jgi:anion-transporting  ArsA/GET3 family ATPase
MTARDEDPTVSDVGWAGVDAALQSGLAFVVVGPGGVGKTTVSAALGVRAAQAHDRRVLVVTVDPARRLADALGVHGLPGEAVLVSVGDGQGRLWVLMVEMSQAWDDLVRNTSPTTEIAEAILANGLYRSLTTRFVASHDYVALDHLNLLADDGQYDLIIVDTPPGEHAVDVFAAPGRLQQFFESRLLRWLTAGVGGGFARVASRPFLAVAERLLGGDFLTQIREFFTLFAHLRPRIVERIERVEALLQTGDVRLVQVQAADRPPGPDGDSGSEPWGLSQLLLVNKVLPTTEVDVARRPARLVLRPTLSAPELDTITDPSLRRAVEALPGHNLEAVFPLAGMRGAALLPRQSGGVNELSDLVALVDEAAAEPWV